MGSATFCTACGAPLAGVGATCTVCGRRERQARLHTPPEDWTRPWTDTTSGPRVGTAGQARRPHRAKVAAALGVVPGLGHLYAGHKVRALAVCSAFFAAVFLGTDLDLTVVGATVGVPLDAGGFGIWLFSIWDAYWTARRDQGQVREMPLPDR